MRKMFKLFVILVISLMVMVACNNADSTTEDNGESTNQSTEETNQTENDKDAVQDSDIENENDDELPETQGDEEVPVLEFGETGVIEDTLGTYEVTPKSFRITDSLGEGTEEEIPRRNDILVVVEIDIKNIGTETLDLEHITMAELYSNTGGGGTGFSNYPEITQFKGEIKPQENFLGHIVFDVLEREYFEISFGANMPSHISNEIRWVLPMEE